MTLKFPSIPDPAMSTDSMRATLLALRDVVRLLVKNAQVDSSGTGYATTAYVEAQINSAIARLEATKTLTTQVKTQTDALSTSVAASLAQHSTEIAAVQADVSVIDNELSAGYLLTGALSSGVLTATGARSESGVLGVLFPANRVSGALSGSQLAAGAVSRRAAMDSAGNSASVTLVTDFAADVLVIAAFTGPAVASPGGTGRVIVNDGTADHTVIHIPVATNALPVSGAILLPVTGAITLTARAEFTTGPTQLNGVSIVAIALQR